MKIKKDNEPVFHEVLEKILEEKKIEIKVAKNRISFNEIKKLAAEKQKHAAIGRNKRSCKFLDALKNARNKDTKIIAEIKAASPSAGTIRENFNPESIALTYQKHKATAISVLTIKFGFHGDIEYLKRIKTLSNIPLLRKDFIFEEYQIYESRVFDADAILLIASILEEHELKYLFNLAGELGMDVLLEVHTSEDLEKALNCNAEIIGINNRNLKTFEVDINTTLNLLNQIPKGKIIVSESGIKLRSDIELLQSKGVNAFLIGSALMRSKNEGEELDKLLGIDD